MSDTPTTLPGESIETTANTLTIVRRLNAPRELVYASWIDPDQLAQWWGPEHLHTPRETVTIDHRVGGTWAATMVMDDSGQEFPSVGRFTRVDPPNGFSLREEAGGLFPFGMEIHVDLVDDGGVTVMTIRQNFETESFDFGDSLSGWSTSLEKLRRRLER
ncbi:SRPBCC family protein [Specibacter cremeus]|uniref:SRPBCC family protein n=1 Tax=Specibacter cremeus TaxID=1629051 RepID=UPI000F7ABD7F|nr:SRPBCC domain-containing protein [Specibacter cremeus]